MTDERDVAITGMGAVTPLGRDVASLWAGLTAGRSGIDTISMFDPAPYPCRIAGEVRGYTPHPQLPAEQAARMDRGVLFAADAALQAVADAGLTLTPENAPHVALVLASARPGETSVWEGQRTFHNEGPQALTAGYLTRTLPNFLAAQVAGILGVRGSSIMVSAGGASGYAALALAAAMIRRGEAAVVIVGGADAAITPPALAAFCAMNILTKSNDDPPRAVRPFDAGADGMALAEGGAVLVLEDESLARERSARCYARLAGAASVTESTSVVPTAPEAGRAIQAALREPALLQSEIDYVCAYAAGSLQLDRVETDAYKRIFGEATASKLTLSAPKSMLGHLLAGAGVVDAIVCAKAIETGIIPPTINLERPAEGCDLDYTPHEARKILVRNAMCYGYGFGGHHVALCFSAP
ncbi:MAG: beta-ketoacyl-[acyl-carrier-protein] synthase family protein [Dehalococcoidia bacterium]